ncbi:hypothetical protein [Chryseobacterium sp. SORGH_AS_1048]|uniref:hypothetical protein n=1 Tax=Chryseobacterium sp. SORGH_AS_1048 TaxID=3041783 RepID=UPI0027858F1A|nr:hypothetical protein [Chryseobacterium sp. SORGH_AS_1048]MDQ1101687.1 hypothetical protein [Chryseobacterium sp. SORGH_AS_1048]
MMRKLISWLSFMMAFSLVLLSCVHDEIYTSSDPASKEYHSKSVFREDEKYIKNVMQIYFEHEAEIKKGNAVPLWDYAMTMGNFDESFLIVLCYRRRKSYCLPAGSQKWGSRQVPGGS